MVSGGCSGIGLVANIHELEHEFNLQPSNCFLPNGKIFRMNNVHYLDCVHGNPKP